MDTLKNTYFSSNIHNGQGGYDIYYVNMQSGAVSTNLIALSDINSKYDEIAPSVINDTLFFSSNREGGLGGFDAYYLGEIPNHVPDEYFFKIK